MMLLGIPINGPITPITKLESVKKIPNKVAPTPLPNNPARIMTTPTIPIISHILNLVSISRGSGAGVGSGSGVGSGTGGGGGSGIGSGVVSTSFSGKSATSISGYGLGV